MIVSILCTPELIVLGTQILCLQVLPLYLCCLLSLRRKWSGG